jgi:formylglycine-generating enzyme required for sulfatase activity
MKALALFFIPVWCLAQTCQVNPAQKRHAFVIGNRAYAKLAPVDTAVSEARAMKAALEGAGFEVKLVENARWPDLLTKDEFGFVGTIQPGDAVFFYYSGYIAQGSEDDDYFLLPVDFDPASPVTNGTFRLTRLLQDLVAKKSGLNVVMVEGPRRTNVPLKGASGLGLMPPDLRDSGEVVFAMAAVREMVPPPPAPQSSAFTQAVIAHLADPGLTPVDTFNKAKDDVTRTTGQKQIPFVDHVGVRDDFCFHAPPPPKIEIRTETKEVTKEVTKFVQRDTVPTNPRDREEYVQILPGKFKMGCVPSDKKCGPEENPQHEVTISKGFWMGRNEVQVLAYQRFADAKKVRMPGAPLYNRGWRITNYPMVLVSWADAKAYCEWAGGRLPTEAEWEYAYRAGNADEIYPLNDENSRDKANFYGTKGNDRFEGAAPVRSFDRNPFNLFDMAGNVWEWTQDFYSPTYFKESPAADPQGPKMGKDHVMRGGSFESKWEDHLRLSVRKSQGGPDYKVGFRCVLEDGDATQKLLNVVK